jgi:hypothetical protein
MRAHDDPVVETPDFLLAALERANEAMVIVDRDLRVTHFNAAAELIWQLDRAEAAHSFGTLPRRSTKEKDWRCSPWSPTGPTAPLLSPITI